MSQQAKPFLAVAAACAVLLLWTWSAAGPAQAGRGEETRPGPLTTVLVIRHADRDVDRGEDRLLLEGQIRARDLVHVVGDAGVRAIYTTGFERTKETVRPLAECLGIQPIVYGKDVKELAQQVLSRHKGEVVLIAGHGDTVAQIIQALGVNSTGRSVGTEFDDLHVVTIDASGKANLLSLKYGKPVGRIPCRP